MNIWYQTQVVGPVRELWKNYGTERSKHWNKTRKAFLVLNPACAICGKKTGLQVHHIVPFHIEPRKELMFANLMVLCASHHFIFGHLGFWKSWNEYLIQDAITWKEKYKNRPTKEENEKINNC